MNKKRVLLIFTIITLLLSLFSCSGNEEEPTVTNRNYNKTEVEEAAKALIENSISLNEILYGKGLEWEEDGGVGIYKKATQNSLSHYDIKTVADLKEKLTDVFSSKYIDALNKSDVFSSVKDGETIKHYTRYYDHTEKVGEGDGEKTEETYLLVNTVYNYPLKNRYEYISEPVAKRAEGEYVIVVATVRATIIGDDGEVKKVRDFEHEIKLIEENGNWRLDSGTYIVYNEYTDIYEDMNK